MHGRASTTIVDASVLCKRPTARRSLRVDLGARPTHIQQVLWHEQCIRQYRDRLIQQQWATSAECSTRSKAMKRHKLAAVTAAALLTLSMGSAAHAQGTQGGQTPPGGQTGQTYTADTRERDDSGKWGLLGLLGLAGLAGLRRQHHEVRDTSHSTARTAENRI